MATLMSYFFSPIAGEWGDEAEDNTDGVPVLRTTNFTADGRLSYDDLTYRSIDTEKKENKILQPGDIIIEKSGGTPKKPVGRCVYFDRDDDYDYFCSNFTAILRANSEEVNTKYLWYLLQEHYKTRQCLKYQYKTNGIANLDIKDYLSHKEVKLPSRELQDKRVEAMDYSQYLLDLHQELLEIMDNAVKSRFIEMFGDPVTNDMNWETDILKNLGELNRGVSKHRPRNAPELLGGPYPLVQTGDVSNADTYINDYSSTYSEIGLKQSRMWSKGTLCITIAANIAQTGILTFDACFPDSVVGFISGSRTNQMYMHYWFSFFQKILEEQAPQSAQKNINLQILSNLSVMVPPLELQEKFAKFVELAYKSKLTIKKSMDNLRELRDSLLQEYFG